MTVETLKSQDFSVLLSNAFGMDKVEDTRKVFEFVINPKSLKREVMDDLRDELASRDFVRAEISDLRTELKQDIADLRTELKKDMANVRAETTDLRTEMANLRTELKQDISDVRAEIDNKIELKVSQSTRTLVVTIISSIIAMSAIIVGGFLALYLKA